jgi:hypothetical protein
VGDFAHDRSVQPILTVYKNGVSYPVASRDELARVIPNLATRFPSYASFGAARLEDIVPAADLHRATVLEAYDFASSIAVNNGNGTFSLRPLPIEAQLSPVNASLAGDFEGDGRVDLLVAGNEFGVPPLFGRYDASYGLLLRGRGNDGRGQFQAVGLAQSGLTLDGQVRHLAVLRQAGGKGGRLIVVARNDDSLQVLRITSSALHSQSGRGP